MFDNGYISYNYGIYHKYGIYLKTKRAEIIMKQRLISAKEIIEKYNLTYQTINHYTNFGLLDVVTKKGNVRMYDEAQVHERLAKITQLVKEGFPLRLIRKMLEDKLAVKVAHNNTGNS